MSRENRWPGAAGSGFFGYLHSLTYALAVLVRAAIDLIRREVRRRWIMPKTNFSILGVEVSTGIGGRANTERDFRDQQIPGHIWLGI